MREGIAVGPGLGAEQVGSIAADFGGMARAGQGAAAGPCLSQAESRAAAPSPNTECLSYYSPVFPQVPTALRAPRSFPRASR